jgi:hypothetical protein
VEQGETRFELLLRLGDFEHQAFIGGWIAIDKMTVYGETPFLREAVEPLPQRPAQQLSYRQDQFSDHHDSLSNRQLPAGAL